MKKKYAEYVREKLTDQEILEQIAEECAELGKASLKLIRANGYSKNITPKTCIEAADNFREEVWDLLSVIALYTGVAPMDYEKLGRYWKYKRWAERLGYIEGQKHIDMYCDWCKKEGLANGHEAEEESIEQVEGEVSGEAETKAISARV